MSRVVFVPLGHIIFEVVAHAFVGNGKYPRIILYGAELAATILIYIDYMVFRGGRTPFTHSSYRSSSQAGIIIAINRKERETCGSKKCPASLTALRKESENKTSIAEASNITENKPQADNCLSLYTIKQSGGCNGSCMDSDPS